jgi:hypothetical protein
MVSDFLFWFYGFLGLLPLFVRGPASRDELRSVRHNGELTLPPQSNGRLKLDLVCFETEHHHGARAPG